MIFISTSRCIGNSEERLDDAIREMKTTFRRTFEADGRAFFAIGAATQWSVEEGLDYLLRGVSPDFDVKEFGPWDEVWAGRNWLNNAAIDFIWRGISGDPVVPQVVVIERSVTVGEAGIVVGEDRLLARAQGGDGIVEWYDSGLPLRR